MSCSFLVSCFSPFLHWKGQRRSQKRILKRWKTVHLGTVCRYRPGSLLFGHLLSPLWTVAKHHLSLCAILSLETAGSKRCLKIDTFLFKILRRISRFSSEHILSARIGHSRSSTYQKPSRTSSQQEISQEPYTILTLHEWTCTFSALSSSADHLAITSRCISSFECPYSDHFINLFIFSYLDSSHFIKPSFLRW